MSATQALSTGAVLAHHGAMSTNRTRSRHPFGAHSYGRNPLHRSHGWQRIRRQCPPEGGWGTEIRHEDEDV